MPGMVPVDNPMPAQSPAPAAPEPVAAPTPDYVPTQTPVAQPGARSIDTLHALLDGADPATLFGGQPEQPPAPGEPAQPGEPTPADPAPLTEPRLEIPDKFQNPDGTANVEAILKSYTGMEKVLGEQGNKLGSYERQLQEAVQLINQFQQPPQTAEPVTPSESEWTPPTAEEYYDDPLGTVQKLLDKQSKIMVQQFQQAMQPLAPVVQKHQYETQVNHYSQRLTQLAETNSDIGDLLPEMEIIGKMLGHDAIQAMDAAGRDSVALIYEAAKLLHKPAPEPPPTPEQLIQDPNYRQKILADPNIKNEILKGHVQAVRDGAPPPVIGSQPGGLPPAAPSEQPRSAREAGSFVQRWLRGQ